MTIREVMTESVVTASPSAPVRQVAELMRERNVGSVVLVEDGRPVAFVTDRDLTVGVLADECDPHGPVSEHASAPVISGTPEMEVAEAGDLMVQHGIRRLPIVDGDRLTGIVTLDDLVVRTGDVELAHQITSRVAQAAMPGFYFHSRGG